MKLLILETGFMEANIWPESEPESELKKYEQLIRLFELASLLHVKG